MATYSGAILPTPACLLARWAIRANRSKSSFLSGEAGGFVGMSGPLLRSHHQPTPARSPSHHNDHKGAGQFTYSAYRKSANTHHPPSPRFPPRVLSWRAPVKVRKAPVKVRTANFSPDGPFR